MVVAVVAMVLIGVYAAVLVWLRRRMAPARVLMSWRMLNLVLWPSSAIAAVIGMSMAAAHGRSFGSWWELALFAAIVVGALYLLTGVHGSVELHAALCGRRRDEPVTATERRAIRRCIERWSPLHAVICVLTGRRYRPFVSHAESLALKDDVARVESALMEDVRGGWEGIKVWWKMVRGR